MASSPRIDDLRKKFEENPRRYFAPLANEYRKAGEIEEAIAICREYLPQQPGHMSGHIVFGQALYEARLFDESKTVFETALTLDPENLIALRHLGDIALLVGDNVAARGWYKRVLDADPRNEEIQSQLAMLDKAGVPGGAEASDAVADPSRTPLSSNVVEQRAVPRPETPSADTTVEQPIVPRPSPTAATVVVAAIPRPGAPSRDEPATMPSPMVPPTPASPTVEVPAASASNIGLEPTSMAEAPPASGMVVESHMAGSASPPPLDSFSLAGLETTSLAAPPPAITPVAAPAPSLPDLDFGDVSPPVPPQSATPGAPAAPAVEAGFSSQSTTSIPAATLPAPEPATAPEILLDFTPPTTAPAAAPEAPPSVPTQPAADAEPGMVDLDFIAPEPASPAAAAGAPPVPPAAIPEPAAPTQDLPMLDVGAPAAPVMTSPAASSPPPPPATAEPAVAEPFMTETMADLYLRQGHREKALEVYRAVLAQRPDDAALRARVAALEADGAPRVAAAQESAHRGPTMREVLGSIASRRPGYRVPAAASNGSPAPASDVAPQSPAGDAFSSLMAGGRPASSDESAAIVLATAFASLNGDGPGSDVGRAPAELQGHPARPAAGDLSLDTVFSGAGTTGGAATGSDASLNQYFSQRALGESRSAGEGRAARNESPEEVAKFTQWLEGLKRR